MGDEVEALPEESLEERLHLFVGELGVVLGLGGDVEVGGVEPVGLAGELVAGVDLIGELDEVGEGGVGGGEARGSEGADGGVAVVGRGGPDGGDLECGLRRGWRLRLRGDAGWGEAGDNEEGGREWSAVPFGEVRLVGWCSSLGGGPDFDAEREWYQWKGWLCGDLADGWWGIAVWANTLSILRLHNADCATPRQTMAATAASRALNFH